MYIYAESSETQGITDLISSPTPHPPHTSLTHLYHIYLSLTHTHTHTPARPVARDFLARTRQHCRQHRVKPWARRSIVRRV